MKFMGIDCHKKYLVTAVMNEQGKLLRQDRVPTSRKGIETYFTAISRDGEPVSAAMEASRN